MCILLLLKKLFWNQHHSIYNTYYIFNIVQKQILGISHRLNLAFSSLFLIDISNASTHLPFGHCTPTPAILVYRHKTIIKPSDMKYRGDNSLRLSKQLWARCLSKVQRKKKMSREYANLEWDKMVNTSHNGVIAQK